jgi:hypothetical protein
LPPLPAVASRFDVPLRYDFTPVLQVVERAVPVSFGSLDSVRVAGTDSSKHFAFLASRGPFEATADGGVVRMRATISYAARGYYKPPIGPTLSAGCGTEAERPAFTVEIKTPLTITSDWHLKSKAAITYLAPASNEPKDRCIVSILKFDVTDRVLDAALEALTRKLPAIDQQISKVNLTKLATGWWKQLNRPIRLRDSVYLMLHPQQLRLGKVTGKGHILNVAAGLDAMPQIVTGPQPRDSMTRLPPLAHDTVGKGFHIMLDGVVDYKTASRAMTSAMSDKLFEKGGQTVRVKWVNVTRFTDGRLSVMVNFTGDAEGRLRLVGTPVYDSQRGVISVPNLDYDLDTDNQLVNAYTWLRSDALRAQMRDAAQISVEPAVQRGKELLLKGLNRKLGDAATLSATVDSVSVQGVFVAPSGVIVRAEATGNAGMAVRQKPKQKRR